MSSQTALVRLWGDFGCHSLSEELLSGARICSVPSRHIVERPFISLSPGYWMWIPPVFLFNSQTLRMKVRRKERWSSTKSPAAVSSCMSLQIATTSSWDREEGAQIWKTAESCPQADRTCQWKGSSTLSHAAAGQVGREKSSNGHLRCAALFFCQTSSQRRLFALLNIQAVLRLDITASLFEVYLQPTIGMQLSNSCRGWVLVSHSVWHSPQPPCAGSALFFVDI